MADAPPAKLLMGYNHVIYGEKLWESDRLLRCSRDAALAYPSIFVSADEHGRFEYNPRRIWKKVFGYRDDVTLEEVTGWLEEYWREKLLFRYHIGGSLAYWYKFKGRKPTERRQSDYPDPTGMPELPYSPRGGGAVGAEVGRMGGALASPEHEQETEQDLEQETRAEQEGRAAVAAPPRRATWIDEAVQDWEGKFKEGSGFYGKIGAGISPLLKHHEWPQVVRPAWQRYLAETDAPKPSAQDFRDTFGKWLPGGPGASRRSAVNSGKAQGRLEGFRAEIQAGVSGAGRGIRPGVRGDARLPPGPGPSGGGQEVARADLPEGTGAPERRSLVPRGGGGDPGR